MKKIRLFLLFSSLSCYSFSSHAGCLPALPSLSLPGVSLGLPSLPSLSLPSVSLGLPSLPSLSLPSVSLNLALPTLPSLSVPNLSLSASLPTLPSLGLNASFSANLSACFAKLTEFELKCQYRLLIALW